MHREPVSKQTKKKQKSWPIEESMVILKLTIIPDFYIASFTRQLHI